MTQLAIDYDRKLPVSAQLAMAQADDSANEQWKRVVDGAILAVARRLPEFTVDEVLEEMERIGGEYSTHNLSALGPRMVRVSKELGYMVASEKVKRSRRPEKNGNLHRVWESKVYCG